MQPSLATDLTIEPDAQFQRIDGFGANINSKYWKEGKLACVLDQLIDDLGATLFRVDVFGKSNWFDPDGTVGPDALAEERLPDLYGTEPFTSGWDLIRHLNQRGIRPYLTASGNVPRWMLDSSGKSLVDYERFAMMMASYVEWAIKREGLELDLIGLLNETDLGPPEGPLVAAPEYPKALSAVLAALRKRLEGKGIPGIVAAEQASFNTNYVRELATHGEIAAAIGVVGMHTYADHDVGTYAALVKEVARGPLAHARVWMTEYGDLDETGELEWMVAWRSTERLLTFLEAGFHGGLVWDAFDNYHDHDEAWTIYGLLRAGRGMYTPKKRYFAAKQVYRFVRPGWHRVKIGATGPDSPPRHSAVKLHRLLAFTSPKGDGLSVVGMNAMPEPVVVTLRLRESAATSLAERRFATYVTSESLGCAKTAPQLGRDAVYPYNGITATVPARSIFTITTEPDNYK